MSDSSFRIIGIRLFDTKWHTVNKILKEGWYPFGNYPEPEDGAPYRLPERSETVVSLYDLYKSSPHIEVSCLVGMNGAGKSTLLDVLYRLINNYSVKVLGPKTDNKHGRHLSYAEGLNADLYYELDKKLYEISCRDKEVSFFEQGDNDCFIKQEIRAGDITQFDHFFYTISNNYSLYSLNDKEYTEKIVEVKEGKEELDTIDGKWVDGLFHKNDGYLSPIVITPFRENGSVNIEKENGLALQRIAAIAVLGTAKGEPSILDGYQVKSVKYKINRSYKRKIEAHYNENWQDKIKKSYFDIILKEFEKTWTVKLGGKLDKFEEADLKENNLLKTTKKELILQYLAYKSFKICMTYDDYYTLFGVEEVLRQNLKETQDGYIALFISEWVSRRKKTFEEVVNNLCNPKFDSHINLKIRQCLRYVDNPIYTKEDDDIDIAELVKGKAINSFDAAVLLLPPAFYHIDLAIEKNADTKDEEDDEEQMTVATLSSGERQMLYTMSYVLYHVKNIQGVKKSENCHQYHHINLIFDEAELYYHPDYQKQFVKKLIDYIDRCNLDKKKIKSINVIIATHSPFVLTDILTQNTLYLSEGTRKTVEQQTFGANYYDMLYDSFFFRDTALGGVATKRIKEWLAVKNGEEAEAVDEEVLSLVGDPLIAQYLMSGYYVQDKD